MSDNLAVVQDFIAAWSRLDVDELVSFFTEDGIYHNMPIAPVQGHAALHQFIAGFAGGWSGTEWEVRHIVAAGDVVIAERTDRTMAGGKEVVLPCCGVFELRGGKIAVWRDYFDMATYTAALAG
ncbi:nuclear transport factor 2 family protein [Novosphingobium sp. B 225]|uniref:nuclear transport factor 2 family protein n=1 Tax=Novosphingobium sp. B 225 TaxID=1961849 RepID=UPI000B4A6999|nr:nuclear transport factor 2 family protein [Novosphingobium sp. B 225]